MYFQNLRVAKRRSQSLQPTFKVAFNTQQANDSLMDSLLKKDHTHINVPLTLQITLLSFNLHKEMEENNNVMPNILVHTNCNFIIYFININRNIKSCTS